MNEFLPNLHRIAQVIYDKKGSNIVALDVSEISSITDFILIAEGNVDRHVIAVANAIIAEMEELDISPTYVEGLANGDWVVIDYTYCIIHLFMPGLREKFELEKLWSEGDIVDLDIKVAANTEN